MTSKKEILNILLIVLILAFTASLASSFENFAKMSAFVLVIVSANVFAKKISAFYLDSEVEVKMWEINRYGFKPGSHFMKSFPAGAFFPIIIAAFSLGYLKWMACLVFDVKAKVYRAAKRYGIYNFSEMTEHHLGLIAASGILINLLLATVGYLIGEGFESFVNLNIYYAFFNMLPISDLDGNKIFFGNIVLWSFLAALCLIGLVFVFFVI